MRTYKESLDSPTGIRWLQYLLYGGLLLYFGRDILVPLSFAVLISFVLYPICAWLERRRVGKLAAILLDRESGFGEQPKVINGASDLFVQVFGDAGRHARFAVGTNALPFNVAVEVDAVFEVA